MRVCSLFLVSLFLLDSPRAHAGLPYELHICLQSALKQGFSKVGSIRLCGGGGDLRTVQNCAKRAMSELNFSHDGAAGLCLSGGGDSNFGCAKLSMEHLRYTTDGAMKLCSRGGTEATALCASRADKMGFSSDGAIRLCGLGGTTDRTQCAAPLLKTYTHDEVLMLCHARWKEADQDPRYWYE